MNLLINLISHLLGFSTISASTLSVEIVISGISVNKFISKICFGKSGRNDKNNDTPAILNIFPKFALVAMKNLLSVFANVLLPSSTPFASTSKSFSSNTKSVASSLHLQPYPPKYQHQQHEAPMHHLFHLPYTQQHSFSLNVLMLE